MNKFIEVSVYNKEMNSFIPAIIFLSRIEAIIDVGNTQEVIKKLHDLGDNFIKVKSSISLSESNSFYVLENIDSLKMLISKECLLH